MTPVLDASVLLAFLHDEPGGDRVARVLDGGHMSTVNWSEVLQKSLQRQVDVQGMQQEFVDVGLLFEPFTAEQAALAAQLWQPSRRHGLSMADRACIALAMHKALPLLTADRAWARLDIGIEIHILRQLCDHHGAEAEAQGARSTEFLKQCRTPRTTRSWDPASSPVPALPPQELLPR